MKGKGNTRTDLATVASNWGLSTRAQSTGLYRLAIIDKSFLNPVNQLGFTGFRDIENQEFIFDVNPRAMDLEEPAAVTIVPTQDGGQFIEHQGQIYKNITIAGTMGVRPNRRPGAVIPVLGIPNPFASPTTNPLTGLPAGEESGFERLIKLRNLFRTYFDRKEDPNTAHSTLLVWQNGKEGEFYIVEPMTFRTRRESSSPISATYEIQLRTIQRFDIEVATLTVDVRTERTALSRLFERTAEYQRKLGQSVRLAEALADRVVGIGQATVNEVITPARTVFDGLANFTTSSARVFAVPRNSVALLATSALNLATALQGVDDELNAYKQQGISTQLSQAFGAYKQIFRQAAAVQAEDNIFSRSSSDVLTTRSQAYRNPQSGPPRTGGSPTDLQNVSTAGGTGISAVGNVDTIFSLAQRLLGDQARWKELVALNDLKAPYVSVDGDGKDVLRPGDNILFPATPVPGASEVAIDPRGEDPLEQRLGRDLKLVSYEGAGGLPLLDLEVNNRGDVATIASTENLAQAVELKFSIERGTLPTHPNFGIAAPIGSKALIRSLIAFQIDARGSLLADSRISDVSRLDYNVEGNVLTVKAEIQVAEVDQKLIVSFDGRR